MILSGQRAHQCGRMFPRGSRLALLESLPKPDKQQHAAQRHEEWNRINHHPSPDSGILGQTCSEGNANEG